MIFTGIKRKSNQLFFNKKAKEFVENNSKQVSAKIKSVIILADESCDKNKLVNEVSYQLKLDDKSITIITIDKKNVKSEIENGVFTPKDFGWYGRIKSEELKSILTKKYDLLINYSKIDNLYNNLVLLQCNSNFKVGFAHLDNRFYDLLINCKFKEISLFNKELKKYLTILNKI
ncbi:hypothetical protein [uncultured Lutibacter sp.]|uniref:DUF6913 domain-containing protein n=1 Tax=uncultured Lutibacter sp. TaxID=437739 RepID=UPI0026223785|nr:hypothetical protein [uncultured Lutibacter sp.]